MGVFKNTFKLMSLQKLIHKSANNPANAFVQFLSLFGALITIIIAANYLSDEHGYFIALSFLTLVVLPPLYLVWIKLKKDVAKIYDVDEQSAFVYALVQQKWHVKQNGARYVEIEKDFMFYEAPDALDLVDTVFGSEQLSFGDLKYSSSTGKTTSIVQPLKHSYNIYWEGQKKFVPGDRFTHKFSLSYPSANQNKEKSFTLSAVTPCKLIRLIVTSDLEIDFVEIKTSYGEIKFWETGKIFAPSNMDHFGMIKELSKRKLVVERESLPRGINHFIKIFYKNTSSS